jgi:hypothetical protein
MAALLWRKQHLATIRIANFARRRRQQLIDENIPPNGGVVVRLTVSEVLQEATKAAERAARKEFGDTYELVEIGEATTVDGLMKDLAVQDRWTQWSINASNDCCS